MKDMEELIRAQDICVLATVSEGMPHSSLMAYIIDEDYLRLYMITHKNTKKYKNLIRNPHVSLLIDSRYSTPPVPRDKVQALTVSGLFEEVLENENSAKLKKKFAHQHKHLAGFAKDEQATLFAIKLTKLQLQHGAVEADYKTVE